MREACGEGCAHLAALALSQALHVQARLRVHGGLQRNRQHAQRPHVQSDDVSHGQPLDCKRQPERQPLAEGLSAPDGTADECCTERHPDGNPTAKPAADSRP